MKSKYTFSKLQPIVSKVESIAGVLRELGLNESGGTHRYIRGKIKELNIDTSHFTGQLWSKGKKLGENYYGTAKPLKEILVKNCYYNSSKLKHRLIRAKLKEDKCEDCGNSYWNNKKLPLELHHINEDPNDNRITNLQILCPNCHSVIDKPEHMETKVP